MTVPPETADPQASAQLEQPAPGPLDWMDAAARYVPVGHADLLPPPGRRSIVPVVIPITVAVCLVGGYAAATLLWPLDAVRPTVSTSHLPAVAAPVASVTWPAVGSAAIGVEGLSTLASTNAATPMASITKVITASMVLEQRPLAIGEQGPEFAFSWADSSNYWKYKQRNESALDVPVDGVLTQYQLLQGVMLGSAGNYTDYLADWVWQDRAAFRTAATEWLLSHGLTGISVVEPTGIEYGNTATPAALVALANVALQNPVFAEIVAQPSADIPGPGVVTNTNRLIGDPGVVGVKTGTLDGWNLLVAKDVVIDGATVRIVAAVLDQEDDETRTAVSRSLLDQVTAQLDTRATIPAGTVVGSVKTPWGATAKVVTAADVSVIGWNGSVAEPAVRLDLGDARAGDAHVGAVTLTGPLNASEVPAALTDDLPDPSAWWRLTHPFQLFGWTE